VETRGNYQKNMVTKLDYTICYVIEDNYHDVIAVKEAPGIMKMKVEQWKTEQL